MQKTNKQKKKNFKILDPDNSVYIGRSKMLTSMQNKLWVCGPWSGAIMVAHLDDVCERSRSHN